jgi:hypothetical protein
LRVLSEGGTRLPCLCGSPECPAKDADAPATGIVIHVVAEQSTLDGTGDTPGLVPGYGTVPAEQVRAMAPQARCRPIADAASLTAEPGYRPSAKLADFVRCRDLTCRWPGCDVPAERADIDHTTPWPYGPTHPSNAKLYCRIHHLVKTFCPGWADAQGPDGTVTVISPAGRIYKTKPDGARFFPAMAAPTAELAPATAPPRTAGRGLAMPTRARTRAQARAYRIAHERALNRDAELPP